MKATRFLSAAVLAAVFAGAAQAAPMIQFVDNLDNSVTLQIVTDATGSLGAELAVEVQATGDLVLTGATVNTALFDTANPGANPFTMSVTDGLYTNLPVGQVFASYGSGNPGIGAFDFLTLEYEGFGTINAFGNVAQQGANNPNQFATIGIIPEPTSSLILAMGLVACGWRCRAA